MIALLLSTVRCEAVQECPSFAVISTYNASRLCPTALGYCPAQPWVLHQHLLSWEWVALAELHGHLRPNRQPDHEVITMVQHHHNQYQDDPLVTGNMMIPLPSDTDSWRL